MTDADVQMTMGTDLGQLVGTRPYTSPEDQAETAKATAINDFLRETLGAANPRQGLGFVLHDQGEDREAERMFRTAVDIWREQYGPNHPSQDIPVGRLAMVLASLGEDTEARRLLQRRQKGSGIHECIWSGGVQSLWCVVDSWRALRGSRAASPGPPSPAACRQCHEYVEPGLCAGTVADMPPTPGEILE